MNTVIYIYIYIYIDTHQYFLVSWHLMTLEYCFRLFFAEVSTYFTQRSLQLLPGFVKPKRKECWRTFIKLSFID